MNSRGPILFIFLRLFVLLTFLQVALVGLAVLRTKAGLGPHKRTPASETEIHCGMFNNKILYQEQVFPPVPSSAQCETEVCEISRYAVPARVTLDHRQPTSVDPTESSDESGSEIYDVHVLSVKKGMPNPRLGLGEVEVHLKRSDRPIVLVLTNRESTVWYLKTSEDVELKEVIVASPSPTWLQGLSPDIPYSYLGESMMCAYPYGWEEHKNPDNEYLRMIHSLRMYTGQIERSFQGAELGRQFEVPYYADLDQEVASIQSFQSAHREQLSATKSRLPAGIEGIKYRVRHHHLVTEAWASIAPDGRVRKQLMPLRATVQSAVLTPHGLFVLEKFRLGLWSGADQNGEAWLQPSLDLPDLKWPTTIHYDAPRGRLLIPDRWEESIMAYHPQEKQWSLFSWAGKGRILAMASHPESDAIYAVRADQGLSDLLLFHRDGQLVREVPLKNAPPFLEGEWRMEMASVKGELFVRIIRPHRPRGDYYLLDPKTGEMQRKL